METQSGFRILMFPWLAHGHIFPYLELAKRLIKNNFYIYFCSTAINFSSINNFIHHNTLDNSIQLVQLHLEPTHELPPHYHTTKNLPPDLLFTLIKAFQTSNSSFSNIVACLKPDLVIYDVFQPWSAKIALQHGIPAVHFATIGAATLSVIYDHQASGSNDLLPFPELHMKGQEMESIHALSEFLYANIYDVDEEIFFGNFKQSCDVVLVKTSEMLEGKYLEYISAVTQKKLVPVGLLVSEANTAAGDEDSEIMHWLSKKKLQSTVYVSFGSECFLSKEEMEEVAKGLELSDANFIWIIRFPIGNEAISLDQALPQGFLDRVKDRGMVMKEWAPQAKILAHPNTAGFISHCGWSSLMESLHFGVPVVAIPMQFDQPINARMVAEAGYGVEVPRGEDGLIRGEEIAKGINKVFEDRTGERLKCRAKELSKKARRDEEEGMQKVADQLVKQIKLYKLQK